MEPAELLAEYKMQPVISQFGPRKVTGLRRSQILHVIPSLSGEGVGDLSIGDYSRL